MIEVVHNNNNNNYIYFIYYYIYYYERGRPLGGCQYNCSLQLPVERVKRWRFPPSAKPTDSVADVWRWRRRRRNALRVFPRVSRSRHAAIVTGPLTVGRLRRRSTDHQSTFDTLS